MKVYNTWEQRLCGTVDAYISLFIIIAIVICIFLDLFLFIALFICTFIAIFTSVFICISVKTIAREVATTNHTSHERQHATCEFLMNEELFGPTCSRPKDGRTSNSWIDLLAVWTEWNCGLARQCRMNYVKNTRQNIRRWSGKIGVKDTENI